MRISQENVHSRWTKSDQSPSPQGTQAPLRLIFPKSFRVLKRGHFKAISKEKRRHHGNVLAIDFRLSQAPKLGITAPRTYGNAVARNLFKRRVRELFRTLKPHMPNMEIVVFPKRGIHPPSFEMIQQDLVKFYAQHAPKSSR